MATLVKFLQDEEETTAIFPQLKYNKRLYGNDRVTCYAHNGQHGGADKGWIAEQRLATKEEYSDLAEELKSIGYDLKILNK